MPRGAGDEKIKSPEIKATIVQDIMPKMIWKTSNLPENTIQKANMMNQVRKKETLNLLVQRKVALLFSEAASRRGVLFSLSSNSSASR